MRHKRFRRPVLLVVLVLTALALPVSMGTASAMCPAEDRGWQFDGLSKKSVMIGQVGVPQTAYFGNGGNQTFTAGYKGTVSATVSATVEAEAKFAMFYSVKASINSSISTSQTVEITHTVSQPVPKGYWGNGRYGRYRTVVTGSSYYVDAYCNTSKYKRVTYYASGSNMAQGWCLWVSTTSMGSQPTSCNPSSPYRA